jgi:hypothetical protein
MFPRAHEMRGHGRDRYPDRAERHNTCPPMRDFGAHGCAERGLETKALGGLEKTLRGLKDGPQRITSRPFSIEQLAGK